jgi:pyrroline-5-carboxylate reductase
MYQPNIGIVGLGNLGWLLYVVFVKLGFTVLVNNGSPERTREKLAAKGGDVSHAASLEQIAAECKYVFLCIKPDVLDTIAPELNRVLREEHYVFSCLALRSMQEVECLLKHANPVVVKVMPTLGVFNGNSITAYQLPYFPSIPIAEGVEQLLGMISTENGVRELHTEKQMQFFTVYVACIPGIIAHFVNLFSQKIVQDEPEAFGWYPSMLPALLRSTADLIEHAGSPYKLWEQVATPLGVTRTMTDVLGKGGLSSIILEAVEAGLQRMNGTKK